MKVIREEMLRLYKYYGMGLFIPFQERCVLPMIAVAASDAPECDAFA